MLGTPSYAQTAGYDPSSVNRQATQMLGNPSDQYSITGTPGAPQSGFTPPSSQAGMFGSNTLPPNPLAGPSSAPGMMPSPPAMQGDNVNPQIAQMVRALTGQ